MRTVFKYYKSYIPLIVGILAFLFGQAMCELALPGIHVGYHQQRDRQGRYGLYLEDRHDHDSGILRECGMLYRQQLFIGEDGGRFARRIRGALFDKVTDFSAAELSEFSTASLITRSTNDVQMVQQTTVMTLRLACFAPIMGIGAVIKALRTSVSLSWTIGVALAVIVVIMLMSFFLVLPEV